MPTKRDKKISEQIKEQVEEQHGFDLEEDGTLEEAVQIEAVARAEGLAGGTVQLDLKRPGTFGWARLPTMPVDQFSIDNVLKLYGGGDYSGMFLVNGHTIVRKFKFSGDERLKGTLDAQTADDLRHIGKQDKTLADAVVQLAQQRETKPPVAGDQMGLFSMMLKMQSDNTVMLMESQKNMMTSICGVITALIQAKGGGSNITPEFLMKVVESNKPNSPAEMVNLFRGVKEIMGEFGGDGGGGEADTWGQVAKYLAPALERVLAPKPVATAAIGVSNTLQQDPEATAAIGVSNSPGPRPPGGPEADLGRLAEQWVGRLVIAAQKDSDPAVYYELMLDQLAPDQITQIKTLLAQDTLWGQLLSRPDVSACAGWFNELRDLILHGPKVEPLFPFPAGGAGC